MSETPRTDAELVRVYGKTGQMCAATPTCGHPTYVPADFARQLERELADAYERAAQVCEQEHIRRSWPYDGPNTAAVCANAIRALIPK